MSGKNVGGNAPEKPPIIIQVGFMSSLDKVYFEIPVLLQMVHFAQPPNVSRAQNWINTWGSLAHKPNWTCPLPKMSANLTNSESLKVRLAKNNIHFEKIG